MAVKLRNTREHETREVEARDVEWQEASLLSMPPAPHGYVLKWIRVMLGNEDDKSNIAKRLQEGWTFVKPEELPAGYEHLPTRDGGRFAGYIGQGDVALAKLPEAKAEARKRFYEQKAVNLQSAVDQQLAKMGDKRMDKLVPVYNESTTRVASGRLAKIDP